MMMMSVRKAAQRVEQMNEGQRNFIQGLIQKHGKTKLLLATGGGLGIGAGAIALVNNKGQPVIVDADGQVIEEEDSGGLTTAALLALGSGAAAGSFWPFDDEAEDERYRQLGIDYGIDSESYMGDPSLVHHRRFR